MQSPFPGMDPFIEGANWQSFHVSMIVFLQEAISEGLPDKYTVQAESNLYVMDLSLDGTDYNMRPDLSVYQHREDHGASELTTNVITPPSSRRDIPKVKVRSLLIRESKTGTLVTTIELLSPSNKGGRGLQQYRQKRLSYRSTEVNLVELDLLRRGTRPDAGTVSKAPYLVQTVNNSSDELLEWEIPLLSVLPTIPIPLAYDEDPIPINLQEVFRKTYRIGRLSQVLTYDLSKLRPPLDDDDRSAVTELLQNYQTT